MELGKAKSLRPRRGSRAKEEKLAFRSRNGNGIGRELLQGLEEPEALVRRPRRKSEADESSMSID